MRRVALIGASIMIIAAKAGSADSVGPVVARSAADWYAMGGVAMHGLALCSVVTLALAAERFCALRQSVTLPSDLLDRVREVIEGANPNELKELVEARGSTLARVVFLMLREDASYERVEAIGALEVHRLQRNLPLLASVGNLATMIGLFGTVMGMIEAFDTIAASGSSDVSLVAGGIFRALVTTAGGLGVGITALGAHAFLSRRADDFTAAVEERAVELFAVLHGTTVLERLIDLNDAESLAG
ncbi:MAG: MotA/TolQ/ExbB proton channel family protein [Myxococcota bacterium]